MSSLLRSTKFVRYFTGAARTLILNAAKTTETTSLINPKALCATNSIFSRDYTSSKKAEQLEPLLQKLDSEVRRYGRITKRDIDEVFDEIRSKNDITSTQSLLVIRCCGELVPEELPEQRTLLVQKIWNVLTERGIPMDISHYNALLRVYIENEHQFSPAKLLEELEQKGLQPNRVTYQRLMWRYCQEGDLEGATKVLEKMRELNMPVSEPVLNALVMGHAFHGDTEGAKTVLETMAGAGLQPTNHTYTLLACGYARKGDINGVNDVIKRATEKDADMTDKDILDIIEHLTIGGHGDKADQLFPHLHKLPGYNQDVCNVILRLLNKGYLDTAKTVMKTMPKSTNVEDTLFKGAFFVKQLIKVSQNTNPDEIVAVCRELKDENLVPNAFYIATEVSLQNGHTELAQKLFKEIEKEGIEIRQHFYWPLLVQKSKENDEEGLLHIIRTMSEEGHVPNGETLRDYVIPYLLQKDTPSNAVLKLQIANVPSIHASRNLMVELLDKGRIKDAANLALQYRLRGQYTLVARSLLNALTKTKDIDSFVSILHVMSSKPQSTKSEEENASEDSLSEDKQTTHEVGRLVKTAVKILSTSELVEKLLIGLQTKGLRINTQSAEEIERYLDKKLTNNISALLAQLTSADLEHVTLEDQPRRNVPHSSQHIELLLEQIKSKGGNAVARYQKQLITAYINENQINKLNNFLEELKSSNFELTAATLAQLYEFYCIHKDVDRAKECHAQIVSNYPDFVLNRYKRILMSEALITAGRFDEAIQDLNNCKQKEENDVSSFAFNSKCWQMLNYLAEQKEDAKVLLLTKTLIENNYIEPSNIILGPSIKVFLLKEDFESALNQFEKCCSQYRCTPWKGELMKTLIIKEDANKLQWLADISTQIHGEVNILHDLVLAFVECGRLRQARRILETPGLHTRTRRLQNACQRYVEEGKSEYLEGLLEATKELSHIDRGYIFFHLLQTYCKADETDKAFGLWTILQEEGEVPSKEFLVTLGNHLKAKNRNIPFVIPEAIPDKQKQKTEKPIPAEDIPKKLEMSAKIEALIQNGNLAEAFKEALESVSLGVLPKVSVMKYLLKMLAEVADVDKIQEIGKKLSTSVRRQVAFDDKLTLATFNKGEGRQHIDHLLQKVSDATLQRDLEWLLQKFPRSSALASIIDDPEATAKCYKIAEIAASKGLLAPMNLLWMEFMLSGKDKEAEQIWEQWLKNSSTILFRRLLQESFTANKPEVMEKLLTTLQSNKFITKGSHGNVYSRLMNLHLSNNNVEAAEAVFKQALAKDLQVEHLNKNTIDKLKENLQASGKEFAF